MHVRVEKHCSGVFRQNVDCELFHRVVPYCFGGGVAVLLHVVLWSVLCQHGYLWWGGHFLGLEGCVGILLIAYPVGFGIWAVYELIRRHLNSATKRPTDTEAIFENEEELRMRENRRVKTIQSWKD